MMREGFVMKRKHLKWRTYSPDMAFIPALTPLEAAVLPAKEPGRATRGALHMATSGFDFWQEARVDQRAKIWVR